MTNTLEKEEFNDLCIQLMGYKPFDLDLLYDRLFNPYENMNHLTDVFDKVIKDLPSTESRLIVHHPYGIRYAMSAFIINLQK